ncbi:hypothetical protein [Pseudoalteromonas nigrifaciens]|uniref:hypothetical protein n=1 Tax=Pseudoalteromonas nigrifaciens TaxID=28109 RepID=UPI003FD47BDD
MSSDLKDRVKIAFEEAGIHPRWHFTKYGYYKLYGGNKFWLAHIAQVFASLFFVLAIANLIYMVVGKNTANVDSLLFMFGSSAYAQTMSDFFVGDYKSSGKMLLGAALCTYIYLVFF